MANAASGGLGSPSITVYPAGSNGNVNPKALITGPITGLVLPMCIAVDSLGTIYVGNANDTITVYPSGSTGNIAPAATIVTGMRQPNGIAVVSNGIYIVSQSPDAVSVYPLVSNSNTAPKAEVKGPDTGLNLPDAIAVALLMVIST